MIELALENAAMMALRSEDIRGVMTDEYEEGGFVLTIITQFGNYEVDFDSEENLKIEYNRVLNAIKSKC